MCFVVCFMVYFVLLFTVVAVVWRPFVSFEVLFGLYYYLLSLFWITGLPFLICCFDVLGVDLLDLCCFAVSWLSVVYFGF